MNNAASFANMQPTVLTPKISRGISPLSQQAVLIASPISAPALQLSPFYKEPSLKIGKKFPPAQACPNYPNS